MGDSGEPRSSLADAAYRKLREDIVLCRLAPGQRFTEKELVAGTGFGLSPLRDGLTRLDHEGLVQRLPRKGYVVTPLTPKSVDDFFRVWKIIGPEIFGLGLSQADEEQVSLALAAVDELHHLAQSAPGVEAAKREIEVANGLFAGLALASGNDYLIHLYEQLSGHNSRIWALVLSGDPTALPAGRAETYDLYRSAVAARDADIARMIVQRYIETTRRHVMEAIVRWPSVMASEVVLGPR